MIRYYDEHGKEIHMRTELDDALDSLLDSYYDMLSKMTAEQRMNYFKYEQFVEPLRYTQDVDNTTYVVRTHFDENADKTILQRIENFVEKHSEIWEEMKLVVKPGEMLTFRFLQNDEEYKVKAKVIGIFNDTIDLELEKNLKFQFRVLSKD